MNRLLALILLSFVCCGCASLQDCRNCPPDRWHNENGKCVCLPPTTTTLPEEVPSASPPAPPEPSAEPTATPTPSAGPSVRPCALPAMPECGGAETAPGVWGCCVEPRSGDVAAFEDDVRAVIAEVVEDPRLVVFGRVIDPKGYRLALVAGLRERGLCATLGGPEDEIGVKGSNVFSEQYDVILGDDGAELVGLAVICRPARF